MADLIEIEVKFRDVGDGMKKAVSTVDRLESRVTRLAKAVSQGSVSQERLAKSLIVAGRELKKNSELTGNQAYGSVKRYFNAQLKRIEAEEQATQATKRASEAYAQARKEAEEANRAFDRQAATLERLRQKYDQGYVAMDIYSKELNDLGTALQKNIITKERYTQELERLNTATKMGTVVSSEFGGASGEMGRRLSRNGVLVQQAGYQIGDFIVQVQSGQNPLIAFGQQATQMAGTLTLLGGAFVGIGTALGVAIPLVTAAGAAFMRAKGEAEEAKTQFEDVSTSLDKIKASSEGVKQELSLLFSIINKNARETLDKSLRQPLEQIAKEMKKFKFKEDLNLRFGGDGDIKFKNSFGLKYYEEAVFLATQLKTLEGETKEELQAQLAAISEALKFRGILTDEVQKTLGALAEEVGLLEDASSAADELSDNLEKAAKASDKLANKSSNIEVEIAKAEAQLKALKEGKDVEVAGFIVGEKAKVTAMYESAKAMAAQTGNIVLMAEATLNFLDAMDALSRLESLRTELNKTMKDFKSSSKEINKFVEEAKRLNEAADPLLKFN
ncbi:MAG: hypothetical protein MJH10_20285, partial [Epibacterium sp.]|nr:hypothetical protein [Epibacterium sp.]NQX75811.1 hypothetical protein [Epibacterium sp.]